jgi:hypothetical protein
VVYRIKKKDLNTDQLRYYEYLTKHWSDEKNKKRRMMMSFFNTSDKWKRKYGYSLSAFIGTNRGWLISNIFAIKYDGANYRNSGCDNDYQKHLIFKLLMKCPYISDYTKIVIIRAFANNLYGRHILTSIRQLKITFNQPESFKKFVEEGRTFYLAKAIDDGDFEIINIIASYRPSEVFIYPKIIRILKSLSKEDVILFITTYSKYIAPYSSCIDQKHINLLSEEIICKILSKNAFFLKKLVRLHKAKKFKLTQKLCDTALDRSGTIITEIPSEFLNDDAVFKAAQKAPSILEKIPKKMLKSKTLLKLILLDQKYRKYFKN